MKFFTLDWILICALAGMAAPLGMTAAQTSPPAGTTRSMPCGMAAPGCPHIGQPMGRGMQGMMTQHGAMGQGRPPMMDAGGAQAGGAQMMRGPGGQTNPQTVPAGEAIYGSQLMTPEERAAYRAKLRAAKTPEERMQIRAAHHLEMQERAAKLGKTLPAPATLRMCRPGVVGGQAIYGRQLMTPAEHSAYCSRLQAAQTPAQRDKIQAVHYQDMQARAKKAGVTLAPPPTSG